LSTVLRMSGGSRGLHANVFLETSKAKVVTAKLRPEDLNSQDIHSTQHNFGPGSFCRADNHQLSNINCLSCLAVCHQYHVFSLSVLMERGLLTEMRFGDLLRKSRGI
jgi:hypothetical protein